MLHREFEPPRELRDTIKCFWYNSSNFEKTQTHFEVVPDGYTEIIFYFGCTLKLSVNGSLLPLQSPFLMGLLNLPAIFNADDRLEIVGIRCFPWTVFSLLGLPPGKNGVTKLEHPIARLHAALEELVTTNKIEEAIAYLKHYFLDAHPKITGDKMLLKAGVAMSASNGSLPVSKVAAAAHATVRTLERKFKRSSGYSVKDVSALIRFEEVRNRLWLEPDVNLAGLAHELGYTDQPHLSREFRRYSGTSPAAFARNVAKEKPFLNQNFITFT